MDNPIFRKLQEAVEHPCRSKDWFGMAEQAINTIYALGEHPDTLCNNVIKNLTRRAFMPRPKAATPVPEQKDPDAMDEEQPANDKMDEDKTTDGGDVTMTQDGSVQDEQEKDVGDAFELSQLLFIVGHVAIKHIVFLELVEREWKRQKDEKTAGQYFLLSTFLDSLMLMLILFEGDKQAAANSPNRAAKDGEELDQVAGNAEDEIGDRIAGVRETELLYGPESLLAIYGPMLVHICGSPHKFKVGCIPWRHISVPNSFDRIALCGRLRHYHLASSYASARSSATSITGYYSRSSKRPKIRTFAAIS